MQNHKYILLTTIFLFSLISPFAAEQKKEELSIPSFSLQLRITELEDSEPPFIMGENLIFTYKPSNSKVRHVGIAFEHEKFSNIHNLYKNENGIFFLLYKFNNEKVINYKFIEDGIWITDSKNSTSITDSNFITLSSYKIPSINFKEIHYPVISSNNVRFKVDAPESSSVYLTGDFNNWNPFLYRLEETEAGIFSININLPKGKYGYYFIINGDRVVDPGNENIGYSKIGEKVSLFMIE